MTASPPAARLTDRVYGGIAALLVALAIFFALRGGPRDGAPAAAPDLVILQPADGAEHPQPLVLVFDAGTEIRLERAGWGAAGRHVHARVDDTELMPGPSDIQRVEGTRYRWTLPRLPAGERRVQLLWSDEAHRPLREGASPAMRVRLP